MGNFVLNAQKTRMLVLMDASVKQVRDLQGLPHVFARYRQQPSPLLDSIDIWQVRNSGLTQRETNNYIARCASVLAWCYLAGRLLVQLVITFLQSISDLPMLPIP